jgi:hypothetical protein
MKLVLIKLIFLIPLMALDIIKLPFTILFWIMTGTYLSSDVQELLEMDGNDWR